MIYDICLCTVYVAMTMLCLVISFSWTICEMNVLFQLSFSQTSVSLWGRYHESSGRRARGQGEHFFFQQLWQWFWIIQLCKARVSGQDKCQTGQEQSKGQPQKKIEDWSLECSFEEWEVKAEGIWERGVQNYQCNLDTREGLAAFDWTESLLSLEEFNPNCGTWATVVKSECCNWRVAECSGKPTPFRRCCWKVVICAGESQKYLRGLWVPQSTLSFDSAIRPRDLVQRCSRRWSDCTAGFQVLWGVAGGHYHFWRHGAPNLQEAVWGDFAWIWHPII